METTENGTPLLFVVLVPHRDCLPALRAYRAGLFAAGMNGAWSFPAAAPLALLNRPLEVPELKSAAAELRKLLNDRKISPLEKGECEGWTLNGTSLIEGSIRFFGITLDLPSPTLPADAVLQRWEKPKLAPVILAPGDDMVTQPSRVAKVPLLTSRAAALANLILIPAPEHRTAEFSSFEKNYSFTWKMGPLFWLPRYKHG